MKSDTREAIEAEVDEMEDAWWESYLELSDYALGFNDQQPTFVPERRVHKSGKGVHRTKKLVKIEEDN